MRYAVQPGLINYNPAQDMAVLWLQLNEFIEAAEQRLPKFLQRIDDSKETFKLAVGTLLVFIRSSGALCSLG